MSEVKRYGIHFAVAHMMKEDSTGDYVLATDHDRLEQECERWKETAAGLDRQNDAIAEEVALALKRVDELRDLLRRISPHFSAPCGLGGLHAEIDAAMSAKP